MQRKLILIGFVVICGVLSAGMLVGLVTHQAQAMPGASTWKQANVDGFGDPDNKQLPSMITFGDYLYTGAWHCCEAGITATAQIWRSSTGVDWEMVDDRLANGAASMLTFKGSIYAGSWDGIVWSSPDGLTWTEVITDGFNGSNQGIARFTVFSDTLYASTWNGETGTEVWRTEDGAVYENFIDAGLDDDPNNEGAIASEVFYGFLYFGVVNDDTGAQIWRTDGITTTAVITDGFGIAENWAISSLAVFSHSLYAGVYNPLGLQVWRSGNGTDWEQVTSELWDPLTREENGMEVFDGQLYLAVANYTTGMEVWRTSNGTEWEQVGFGGFGDANNNWTYWDNAMTVFNDNLYIAANNWPTGGEIWQLTDETYTTYLPLGFKNFSNVETGKVVFVSNRDGTEEIYSMNYDGSGVTRLTENNSIDLYPDWSPDGSKIAFSSDRSGKFEIYVMNADGSAQTQITTLNDCHAPQWSPDGSRIAFDTRKTSDNRIYSIDPDGTDLVQVTEPPMIASNPYWSPDGTKIAFIGLATSTLGIYMVDADGTNMAFMVDATGAASFSWSPDGKQLAFSKAVPPNYNFDLYIYNIASGVSIRLTDTLRNQLWVDWSPDGHHLIFHSNLENISNFEIFTISTNGDNLKNLTNNPGSDIMPDWTR